MPSKAKGWLRVPGYPTERPGSACRVCRRPTGSLGRPQSADAVLVYKGRKLTGTDLPNTKGHAMRRTLIATVAIVVLGSLAAGIEAQPSVESKTYEHSELGFTVHYPATFVEGEAPSGDLPDIGLPESEVLFLANSPQLLPNVAILVHSGSVSLESVGDIEAVYAALSGGEVKTESARETTLRDGVTEALEIVVATRFRDSQPESVRGAGIADRSGSSDLDGPDGRSGLAKGGRNRLQPQLPVAPHGRWMAGSMHISRIRRLAAY